MISSSTPVPMRLDAYDVPLGLYVDKSFAFQYGGGGGGDNEDGEMDVMVQMTGGSGSYHRHMGDGCGIRSTFGSGGYPRIFRRTTEGSPEEYDDWLPSERFEQLFSIASVNKRSKKNVTKKLRRSPSSSPSSSWKFW